MSRPGGAGGAFRRFSSSFFACIGKRPRNSVVAHPAHPEGPMGAVANSVRALGGGHL
jgi:hypothetical protein